MLCQPQHSSRADWSPKSSLYLLAICLLVTPVALATADGDLHTEIVISLDSDAPGPYRHPSMFDELDNGDLYAVYYGGAGEYEGDTAVYGFRKPYGSDTWTRPQVIADTPGLSEGNAVVWQGPGNTVWLFYLTRYGETWSTSRIKCKTSSDGGRTWTDPRLLSFEEGLMVRAHPIVLLDGDYLLPIYHEAGHDTESVGADSSSLFFRYHPKTREWTRTNRVHSRIGNIQPAVVQIDKDYLVAYSRRGGGYGPMKDGYLVRSESRDGGRTWSDGTDSQFPNPNSAADLIKLKNGHLLLVYNDNNEGERLPLTVAISDDNDRTWKYKRDIVTSGETAAYPTAVQTRDGKIHVIYTSHERQQIDHVVFEESAILSHRAFQPAEAIIETVCGTGQPDNNGDAGKALDINVGDPFGVEVGPEGALYVTEVRNHRVRRLDLNTGRITTVAGCGRKGYSGDGGPATEAELNEPYEVRFDREGNLFFVEMQNHVIRKVDAKTGTISTVAGVGEAGYGGDGGPAVEAKFFRPHSIVLDGRGGLYVADIGNHRIRRIDLETGIVESIAGNGEKQLPHDGQIARGTAVVGPRALFIDGTTMWVALREGHSVWTLDLAGGRWNHVAGTGAKGFSGDGGPAKDATFNGPKGIAVGPDGNVFVVDTENQAIRKIDTSTGLISTVAGGGPEQRGGAGDGGPATKAQLDRPHGICVGGDGTIYIGDTLNHRVRRVQ